jgi:A/G-specific adenine glycosylase
MGTRGMRENLAGSEIRAFREVVWRNYREHGRMLPWRETTDPYQILVSEVMLQQTQVARVIPKYSEFLDVFPDVHALARASLREVLRAWQGLGYNRRALALHRLSRTVIERHGVAIPTNVDALRKLPGVGHATASAICAFAFNQPVVFVETNIRAAFIHHFFRNAPKVRDRDILPLVAQTLDRQDPREWYYALMDYGVVLKEQYASLSRRSAHHARQSAFEGSNRQLRGGILRIVAARGSLTEDELRRELGVESGRTASVVRNLMDEGFIQQENHVICVAESKPDCGRSAETPGETT